VPGALIPMLSIKSAKKLIFLISLIFSFMVAFAQSPEDQKFKINPTKDKVSPTGLYIPKNLEDCFKELEKMLPPDLIAEMKTETEDNMVKYHRGLGMWMRNNWGLWSGSRLAKYFNALGIRHPDDMSGIILDSFWRHLNNKPIQLKEQIRYYQNYWKKIRIINKMRKL
jgi:hypothetical protein